jgi:preprotein translocase subunit SecE
MANDVAKDKSPKKKRTSIPQFIDEVRKEWRKVTWPTVGEWRITSLMVFVMVAFASLFFFLVDTVIGQAIQFILGFGS